MGVLVETEERWELKPSVFVFLFAACFASLALQTFSSSSTSKNAGRGAGGSSVSAFDVGLTAPFLRFQRSFLLLYSLASVIEGIQSVFGEFEFDRYVIGKEQMALCLALGSAVAVVFGTFSGMLSDIMGPKNGCLLFCILHLLVGVLKSVIRHPSPWVASICLSLASSWFSFCFESWMVMENEKQGHKQEFLNETFWLMTFFESASFIGSQGVTNLLIKDLQKGLFSLSAPAALLAIISILYIRKDWSRYHHVSVIGSYKKSFSAHVLKDKRTWILGCAQASIHFSVSIFWILWAPTIVADGRVVQLSTIYPCFIGSRMLGSTAFPWFNSGASSFQVEGCLTAALGVAGVALLVVAYDYQEIAALVFLFSVFHACIGFSLPSLAKLRTMYLPNELRGGMMSFFLAPANAGIFFVFVQGGYHRNLENSTIMALAAFSLLTAAGCMFLLKYWRKHPRQNRRSL